MKATLILGAIALVCLVPQCQGEDLRLYKACMMECYRCVKTYGKQVYNGKLCAQNCAMSSGKSIDAKCYPPPKRTENRTLLTSDCARLCQNKCAPDFDHTSMDAHACIFTCIFSSEKVIEC